MDNKRLGKKFSTIFWWLLTIAPILIIVFKIVESCFNSQNGIDSVFSNIESVFDGSIFDNYFNFVDTIPSFIKNPIVDFFANFTGADGYLVISYCFAWGVWIQLIHLFFDVICWIPRWCHDIMERKC